MSKWEVKEIKQLGRVVTGKTPPKDEKKYFDGEFLFVSPKDLEFDKLYVFETETSITKEALDKFKNQVIPRNAVMYTSLSFSFGKIGIASEAVLTNQQISSIVVNSSHDCRFVYYLLRANRPLIFSYNSGIDTPIVPKSVFEKIEFRIPPLPIQNKIAAVLSAYDDLIENNDRRITLLEKMAEEIYREWFVRLRFPGFDRATFHKGIPEGWQVVTLGDLADITSSKRIYAEDYVQEGVPFYRSKEIIQKASNIEISEPLFISHEKFHGIKNRFGVPQEGDILITSVGTLGISYFVKESDYFYFKDGNLIWFKKNDNYTSRYLYSWINSEQGKNSLLETSIGTSQAAFTIVNLKKINIIKPPKAMLEKFVSFIDPIDSQKEKLSVSVQNLKQTRDRLLTRLISGKLSVEDLDIQFPPSMTTDA